MKRGSNFRWSNRARSAALVAALIGVTLISGCSDSQPGPITSSQPAKGGAGSIGVVILIDTSGSMKDLVPDKDGKKRPKNQLANEALTEILRQTADWTRDHKDKPLNLSISTFSDKTRPVLAMAPFDKGSADAAVKAVPPPNGGTATGLALRDAYNVLKP